MIFPDDAIMICPAHLTPSKTIMRCISCGGIFYNNKTDFGVTIKNYVDWNTKIINTIKFNVCVDRSDNTMTENATEKPKFRKSTFAIDDNPSFPGYTYGAHWNGWACPYFTKETAIEIMQFYYPTLPASHKEEQFWGYNPKEDYFIGGNIDHDDVMAWEGTDIEIDGETIRVYPIGAWAWIWSDDTEE